MEVTDRLHNTILVKMTEPDLENREKNFVQDFDVEFTQLFDIAPVKAQTLHDVEIFRKLCENIKDDLKNLHEKIKELKHYLTEGKKIYRKFFCAHTQIRDITNELINKIR